jgi:hypothetical protein
LLCNPDEPEGRMEPLQSLSANKLVYSVILVSKNFAILLQKKSCMQSASLRKCSLARAAKIALATKEHSSKPATCVFES